MNLRVAYACFLFCGLSWLTIAVGVVLLTVLPLNENWAAFWGIGVAAPLMMATFVALIGGIVESLYLRQWPLIMLSVLSLVTPVVVFGEYGGEGVSTALAVSGGLVVTLSSGRGLLSSI